MLYEQNSIQLTANTSLDIPVGTAMIQLYCSIPNSTWQYPVSPYISINNDVLRVSLFSIQTAGSYQCIGNESVEVNINGVGKFIENILELYRYLSVELSRGSFS